MHPMPLHEWGMYDDAISQLQEMVQIEKTFLNLGSSEVRSK